MRFYKQALVVVWEFLAFLDAAAPIYKHIWDFLAKAKYMGKSPYFWCCNQRKEERDEGRGKEHLSKHAWRRQGCFGDENVGLHATGLT